MLANMRERERETKWHEEVVKRTLRRRSRARIIGKSHGKFTRRLVFELLTVNSNSQSAKRPDDQSASTALASVILVPDHLFASFNPHDVAATAALRPNKVESRKRMALVGSFTAYASFLVQSSRFMVTPPFSLSPPSRHLVYCPKTSAG